MKLQLAMEKLRLVRWLKSAFSRERWERKTTAADRAADGCPATPREIDAAIPDGGGVLDVHPLFVFDSMQTLIDCDRLYWQAAMDLATHDGYPDSEIAKAKKLAAARMQKDARARAVQALGQWKTELEQDDLP